MLIFEEKGKPEYPEKNLSEQGREPTTNSTLFPVFVESVVGTVNKDIGAASQMYYSVFDYVCDAGYRKRTLSMLTLRVISIKFPL